MMQAPISPGAVNLVDPSPAKRLRDCVIERPFVHGNVTYGISPDDAEYVPEHRTHRWTLYLRFPHNGATLNEMYY